ELQRRAAGVLDLGHAIGSEEIPALIGLGKDELGIDPPMEIIGTITTPDELKAKAATYVGRFVNRLLGAAQANPDCDRLLKRVHDISTHINDVEKALYTQFKQTLTNTYGFNLRAAYVRSSDSTALVDVSFDLGTAKGKALYNDALCGNFQSALT